MGKCFVRHTKLLDDLDAWLVHPDHFHSSDRAITLRPKALSDLECLGSNLLSTCEACLECRLESLEKQNHGAKQAPKLQGLELFSGLFVIILGFLSFNTIDIGAGGLSTGLDWSGHINTKWLVELSSSCALTLK